MSNYKKCDVCGNLHPEEDLEEITITIKKCKECDVSSAPVLEQFKGQQSRPEMKTLDKEVYKPYAKPPADLAGAFRGAPEE